MRVPRSIRVVDGTIPKLDIPKEINQGRGHVGCSLIVGLPPGINGAVCDTWSISTNSVTLVISPIKILTDVKDEYIQSLVMPVPNGGNFTDMTTSADGLRTGTRTKKGGAIEEVFAYSTDGIAESVKSWRINFDRLLGFIVDRLKKPTDESPVVFVAFDRKFIDEIAGASKDGQFWLAIPAVRAEKGVYVSDSMPAIGAGKSGEVFALSPVMVSHVWLNSVGAPLTPGDPILRKVLPLIQSTAAKLTRTLRHLGSLIGKSVETQVPDDW